jgi:hypothetical protein
MTIAGGCGSGSIWRSGEGQVKLIIAAGCFALSGSLFKKCIESSEVITRFMGSRVFMPHYLTYRWTLIVLLFVLFVVYIVAAWNEETDEFTVET